MTAPLPSWQLRPLPTEYTRNDDGYVVEPPYKGDDSSWWGRRVIELDKCNRINANIQRKLGYQVYPDEPGQHPSRMTDYEKCMASEGLRQVSWCTII
jgi:hypothetical protein